MTPVVSHPSAGACQNSLKAVGGNQTLALATTAMVSVEPEPHQGPPAPSIQPCHVLTFSPIKIPVLASPFPGKLNPGGTEELLLCFLCNREVSECVLVTVQGILVVLLQSGMKAVLSGAV